MEDDEDVTNHSIMFTGHTDLDVRFARDYPRFLKITLCTYTYTTQTQEWEMF